MATIYLNLKTSEGIETIDELNENLIETFTEISTKKTSQKKHFSL